MSAAAYPLQPLLSVRHIREENAKRTVRAAEEAVRQADELVVSRTDALTRYRAWLPGEEDRRYAAILGQAQTLNQLDAFKGGLGRLREDEIRHQEAVLAAQREREEKAVRLEAARAEAGRARREAAKIETHKDIWMVEFKKEAERAEERELEDFRPVLLRGAEGDDA